MKYHKVIIIQNKLAEAIKETISNAESGSGVNSIVKFLALGESAKIPELKGDRDNIAFDVLMSEINQMRRFMEQFLVSNRSESRKDPLMAAEYERLSSLVDRTNIITRAPAGIRA